MSKSFLILGVYYTTVGPVCQGEISGFIVQVVERSTTRQIHLHQLHGARNLRHISSSTMYSMLFDRLVLELSVAVEHLLQDDVHCTRPPSLAAIRALMNRNVCGVLRASEANHIYNICAQRDSMLRLAFCAMLQKQYTDDIDESVAS